MSKVSFGMIVFNGNYVLEEVLKSVYPYAHQILIAEGPVKYWQEQGYTTSTDGTNEILHQFNDPEKKIKIVHGQFSEKDQQCNAYMEYLSPETDYIWNLDSDEIFNPEDIETIIQLLQQHKPTSVGFKSLSFYGGFDHYLTGFEENVEFRRIGRIYPGAKWKTHRPPIIANSPWPHKHINLNITSNMGIRMYHYSYVFPDQVKQKTEYYKAAVSKNNCIDNYFKEIYLPWVTQPNKKAEIENKYDGVHEWKPEQRGVCRTTPFTGTHPIIIQNNMSRLKEEFYDQLQKYMA